MSLHILIEPAGALQTGWKLVPKGAKTADCRNIEPVEDAGKTPKVPDDDSRADHRSAWEMGEIG